MAAEMSPEAHAKAKQDFAEFSVKDSEDVDTSCGWMTCRPAWLQIFNTPKWLLVFLCQYFLCQSITVNGLYSLSISTLEKRFGFSSTRMGILTSTYDIAALFLNFIVAYYGQSRKKSTFLGGGLLIMGIGMMVFTLPQFIEGRYEAGQVAEGVDMASTCPFNSTAETEDCQITGGSNINYAVFIIGMALMGVGATPMVSLGLPYLDENVKPKVSSMYAGIYLVSGVIGTTIGFVLSGVFLGMYVDLGVETSLTEQDERWVGNWWLGFIIFSVVSVIFSACLFAYPKELPGTKEMRKVVYERGESEDKPPTGHTNLKDIPLVVCKLAKTPSYVFILLSGCCAWFLITAVVAFMPKIMQIEYRYTPAMVSFIFGLSVTFASCLGQLAGSYFVKRYKLGGKKCLLIAVVAASLGVISLLFLFVGCENVKVAGVNTVYSGNSSTADSVIVGCNAECFCSSLGYNPVCGSDGVSYITACHAGCSQASNQSYSSCSCIAPKDNMTSFGTAVRGLCPANCGLAPVFFLGIFFIYAFTSFFAETPYTIALFRCVPFDQRAAAMGLQLVVNRAFGGIPGPIVFGILIDGTCRLWDTRCGETGNCVEYDNQSLIHVIVYLTVSLQALITLSNFLAWKFYPTQTGTQEADAQTSHL